MRHLIASTCRNTELALICDFLTSDSCGFYLFPQLRRADAHVSICQMGIELACNTTRGPFISRHRFSFITLHHSAIFVFAFQLKQRVLQCSGALNDEVPLLHIRLHGCANLGTRTTWVRVRRISCFGFKVQSVGKLMVESLDQLITS